VIQEFLQPTALGEATEMLNSREDVKVLAGGTDLMVLLKDKVVSCRYVMDIKKIPELNVFEKTKKGLEIGGARIIDPAAADNHTLFSEKLYELRKTKGMTPDEAGEIMKNTLYYGVMMVKEGLADGMVAGAVNSTPDVLRPGLQILKTAPGIKMVSSFFVMVVPDCQFGADGVFIFSDSGIIKFAFLTSFFFSSLRLSSSSVLLYSSLCFFNQLRILYLALPDLTIFSHASTGRVFFDVIISTISPLFNFVFNGISLLLTFAPEHLFPTSV